MVAPGAGLRGVTLFRSKTRSRPKKKDLCSKASGFLVQMKLESKQNEKARSSSQISGVIVLHHNMVSPQMVSPGAGRPPAPLGTPLIRNYLLLGKFAASLFRVLLSYFGASVNYWTQIHSII